MLFDQNERVEGSLHGVQPRLAIRGTIWGGYGLPGFLAFITVFGGLAGIFDRVWLSSSAMIGWLLLYFSAVGSVFVFEAINRRNVLEISGDRIRWSFRQPPQQGDEPVSGLKNVEVSPSGARLVFDSAFVFASGDMFRRRDIKRFVEELQRLGAQVSPQPGVR